MRLIVYLSDTNPVWTRSLTARENLVWRNESLDSAQSRDNFQAVTRRIKAFLGFLIVSLAAEWVYADNWVKPERLFLNVSDVREAQYRRALLQFREQHFDSWSPLAAHFHRTRLKYRVGDVESNNAVN